MDIKRNVIFSFLLFSIFLANGEKLYCQEIQYSQLSNTQLAVNPAFVGIMYGPRAYLHYRTQYPRIGADVNSGYTTLFGSYDQFVRPINSGFGMQILSDKLGGGILSRYAIEGIYAYQIKINRFQAIRVGLSATYHIHQFDFSSLRFYDQIDPILGFNSGRTTSENVQDIVGGSFWNANAGIVYFTNDYYLGVSARNLFPRPYLTTNATAQTNRWEHTLLSAQAGYSHRFGRNNAYGIFPYLQYDRQYGYQKITANLIGSYQIAMAGLGARYNFDGLESIVLMAGIHFKNVRISYSYDAVVNRLASFSGGSHEVGVRFLLQGEQNSLQPNEEKEIIYCPDFMKY